MIVPEKVLEEVDRRRREESRLYDNYVHYYEKRDFVKASEFLWGSIQNILYGIGLFYGKKLGDFGKLMDFLKDLLEENNIDPDMKDAVASIHANFYHGWMDEETFKRRVLKVEELRNWLKQKLDSLINESIRRYTKGE